MNDKFSEIISDLKVSGNYRSLSDKIQLEDEVDKYIDFSSNDYLSISTHGDWVNQFISETDSIEFGMTSSASRLLSLRQKHFTDLENLLSDLYNKKALIFNSGYHANTGIIGSIADKDTLIIADRLVHASIIDGIILSRAKFIRYRHNDYAHLASILQKEKDNFKSIIVVTESIFSMDGDRCDLNLLCGLKKEYPNILLYIDEAHAFGVEGQLGLGCCEKEGLINNVDIIIGTLGKAAASTGAFAITSEGIREFLINKCRSFIFSTAIPPVNCAWSKFVIEKIITMEEERNHLNEISSILRDFVNPYNNGIESSSQIIPLIVGDSQKALDISVRLRNLGFIALPIRTPTVPKGTERIRFSLNSNITFAQINNLKEALKQIV